MKEPIVILHGWGSLVSGEKRFASVKRLLEEKGYTVFVPDLPGFGENTLKKEELFFEDYIAFVKEFIEKHKLRNVILVGHSFGGRIAIAFSALYPQYVSKLILAAPSGIPHSLPSIRKKLVYVMTKIAKPFFSLPLLSMLYKFFRKAVYYAIGEMDYYKSGKLSKTFKNVYQVSIVDALSKIKIPTLLIWGEDDAFVPLKDGFLMREKIVDAKLIVEKNQGHKFPYEDPSAFVKDVISFLK